MFSKGGTVNGNLQRIVVDIPKRGNYLCQGSVLGEYDVSVSARVPGEISARVPGEVAALVVIIVSARIPGEVAARVAAGGIAAGGVPALVFIVTARGVPAGGIATLIFIVTAGSVPAGGVPALVFIVTARGDAALRVVSAGARRAALVASGKHPYHQRHAQYERQNDEKFALHFSLPCA